MSAHDELKAALAALQRRVEELEQQLGAALELARGPQGENGRDGKDGRDGRDATAPSAKAIASAFINMMPPSVLKGNTILVEPSVVVRAPDVTVQPPQVFVNVQGDQHHMHVEGVESLENIHLPGVKELSGSITDLIKMMKTPVKPMYDKDGKLIGAKREESAEPSA